MPRVAALSLLILLLAAGAARTDGEKKQIKWIESFADGVKAAKEAKKPVFVEFFAEWCPGCQDLQKGALQDEKVIRQSEKFVCIHVDTDKDRETPEKYNVQYIPTLEFLKSSGDVIKVCEAREPADVAKAMEEAAKDYKEDDSK